MKTNNSLIIAILFSLMSIANLYAQNTEDTPKEIAQLMADSTKIQTQIAQLQKEKLKGDEYLLGLQTGFLKNTVKDSPNKAKWSVLFELDKEIIEQMYEYEKYSDTEIIDIIVDITGEKTSYETLLSGEKENYSTYLSILDAFIEHNDLKLEIFRAEQKLLLTTRKLKNLRTNMP